MSEKVARMSEATSGVSLLLVPHIVALMRATKAAAGYMRDAPLLV